MHICWTFEYALKERDVDHPGQLKDFDSCHASYTGHIEAPSAEAAVEKLKSDFHMLTVEVLTDPVREDVSDEEYENN